jgi:hypothetical protein
MLLLARADGLQFGPRSKSSEYITECNLVSEYNYVEMNAFFLIPISIQTSTRPAISIGLTSFSGLKTPSGSFLGATQASLIPQIDVPNAIAIDHRDLHLELSQHITPQFTQHLGSWPAKGATQGADCKAAACWCTQ